MSAKRVLVAEDDREMLELVSHAIAQLGLDVVTAASGGELLDAIAHRGPFDLVVTDVSMPWMTGLQVMHSARAAGQHCPIIVITALRDTRTSEQVKSLGSDVRLLRKPFTMADVEQAVQAALGEPAGSPARA